MPKFGSKRPLIVPYLLHIAIIIWSMLEMMSFCRIEGFTIFLQRQRLRFSSLLRKKSIQQKRLFLELRFRSTMLLKESLTVRDLTPV